MRILTTEILPEIEYDLIDTPLIIAGSNSDRHRSVVGKRLGAFAALRKHLRKSLNHFDVINVHNYPAELCTFPHVKPVVWMCNEPPEVAVDVRLQNTPAISCKRLVYRAALKIERQVVRKYVTAAVVADEFNNRRFERLYGFSPSIVNYGIDCNYFSEKPMRPPENRNPGFTLLHVGMITPLKNQLASVGALQALKGAIPGLHLILAGQEEGSYADSVRAFIRNQGLGERVTFTGHVDRQTLRRLYYSSDVLLHPVKSQGGWLSPFEALCAGLPVIVSREMTASKIIEANELGIVTDNLPEAILEIFRDQTKYRDMAAAASLWTKRHLSWDMFSEKMLSVFYSAVSGFRRNNLL